MGAKDKTYVLPKWMHIFDNLHLKYPLAVLGKGNYATKGHNERTVFPAR